MNKITNPGRRTWIHGEKGINEKNKNKQATKEFDKEDLEEVGGGSHRLLSGMLANSRLTLAAVKPRVRDPMYPLNHYVQYIPRTAGTHFQKASLSYSFQYPALVFLFSTAGVCFRLVPVFTYLTQDRHLDIL